jgi:hypothetical protein
LSRITDELSFSTDEVDCSGGFTPSGGTTDDCEPSSADGFAPSECPPVVCSGSLEIPEVDGGDCDPFDAEFGEPFDCVLSVNGVSRLDPELLELDPGVDVS